MSASFYDILKYAKTGIASPEMTAYDKMRAMAAAGGWTIKTLTGVPPLGFRANGKPLISWSMLGNAQQTGTPTPDAPIMPEECGNRTGNLFDKDNATVYDCYIVSTGLWATGAGNKTVRILCDSNTQYTLSTASTYSAFRITETSSDNIPSDGSPVSGTLIYYGSGNTYTFTTSNTAKYIIFQANAAPLSQWLSELMLNTGSTALPYEPYGYKIPLTCSGQTVPVYLGQTQTVRRIKKLVLTGEEDAWGQTEAINSGFYFNMTGYLRQRGVIIVTCSHYVSQGNINGAAEIHDGKISFYANATQPSNRFYIKDSNYANLAAFKSYLATQYNNGTPVTVWYVLATPETGIVNEPLCKIGDYADELHSEDTTVSIPTVKGQNTLTVDTELQPSEMTITYCG